MPGRILRLVEDTASMREILTVNPKVPLYNKDIRVVEWTHGDPFPEMGSSVGVDTETELITDSVLFPPVVVLGCFDGENQVCYIVHWQDIPEFMRNLCVRDIEQRYFNLGFDEGVIDNEEPAEDKPLLEAIDAGRVRDMQIRIHLHDIANVGWIPKNENSLAGCAWKYLKMHPDKGDVTEESARLSFRRDREITEEQYRYLPFDCISTWLLGEVVPQAPVDEHTGQSIEVVHAQGMVALAHLRANGVPVDMRIFDALEDRLKEDYQEARKAIVAYGYPDPDYDAKSEKAQIAAEYVDNMRTFLGDTYAFGLPSKMDIRQMIAVMHAVDGVEDPEEIMNAISIVAEAARDGVKSLKKGKKGEKGPQVWWDEAAESHNLLAFTNCTRPIVMLAFITRFIGLLANQRWAEGFKSFDVGGALDAAGAYLEEHPQWLTSEKPIGPKKFFQRHVAQLLATHQNLKLKRTKKSGEIQLTKNDLWRLADAGVQDQFLTEYARLQHVKKYLSTYLNREFIASDGRIHARYRNLVRTGRTSCSSPNVYG